MPIVLTRNFDGEATEDFAAEVKRRSAASCRKGLYDFIYIVPTRRRVRELQRELAGDVVFGKIPVYTLELFAREIFAKLDVGTRIISPSMQGMIISEILSDDDFIFFRYLSYRPGGRKGVAPAGTIKKIVDQIDYLRENGIAAGDYERTLAAAEDSERNKLSEFLRIYREYEIGLGNKLIDSAGLLTLVNGEISRSPDFMERSFLGNLTLFVEGFYSFKKPELEFLKILSSRRNLSFLIKLDCVDTNEDLFKMMLGTASDLQARGFKRIVRDPQRLIGREENRPNRNVRSKEHHKEFFAANLFAEEYSDMKLDMQDKIFVTSASDRLRQIEFVAEKIKETIKNDPALKLESICVASYLPQDYSQIVREVFAKYRIPSNVTDRFTLESSGVVNAILSFINVRLADYERSSLLRAITNRFIALSHDLSPSAAGSIVYDAAAVCKFERGLRSFKEAIAYRLELVGKLGTEDLDEDEIQIRRNVRTLKLAQEILESVERMLLPFTREMTPSEFRTAIKSLLSNLKIYESIARLNVGNVAGELVERDARALSKFLDVVDEIVGVEMEKGNRRLELDLWIEKLRSALSLTRYNVRQKYGYGVYVTSLEEIRGLEFDYMFIVGLNEGELPSKYSPEIFLPMVSQKENRDMQPYLQRHLFYQALSSFEKELYLVYALRTDDVRLIRSSFIDAVLDVVACTSINDSETGNGRRDIYNVQQAIGAPDEILKTVGSRDAHLLPENLERCKKAEVARYKDDKESEFHGRIGGNDSIELLSGKFADRIFSSAQLESLSRCGFQYFARRILEIAEVPDIETSLSAIERGAVLHRILFRFYSEMSKSGRLDNARNELKLLFGIGRQVLDELGIKHDLFEVERETILGTSSVKGTLELFLEKVQSKLSEYGFQPKIFELAFGMYGPQRDFSRADSSEREHEREIPPVKIGNILLRGKIDRVDACSNGFTIFDYKTSSVIPSHKDVVGDRISPQLILYLSALDQIMSEKEPARKVAGAAFISINRDKLLNSDEGEDLIRFIVQSDEAVLKYTPSFGSGRKSKAADRYPDSMDKLLKETGMFFGEKVSEAAAGRFNLTKYSYERVCAYCSYSEACRVALRGEKYSTEESF